VVSAPAGTDYEVDHGLAVWNRGLKMNYTDIKPIEHPFIHTLESDHVSDEPLHRGPVKLGHLYRDVKCHMCSGLSG
jgi:hypothetical protein